MLSASFSSLGSSALRIAMPSGLIFPSSSPLAFMTASIEPNPSRCAGPIFVIRPTSGRQISASRSISPGLFIPSSTTAHWWSLLRLSSVKGSPMSLFKLPWVDNVQNRRETTSDVILRVLVFPFEPVMAITETGVRLLLNAAISPRALVVSSTVIQTTPVSDHSGLESMSAFL